MSIVSLLVRVLFLAVLTFASAADAQCVGGCLYGYCDGSACVCYPGASGANCDISPCSPNPCQNDGICDYPYYEVPYVDNGFYYCTCLTGFQGVTCQTNINDCASNPCQNGGTCVDGINSYTCDCPAGFGGANCQTNIDDCSPNPCQNGGTCTDGINSYTCDCPPGFSGANCQTNASDDCAPNPCQNGGACIDGVNSYTCDCAPGFVGADCETNVDDCAGAPCQNGGVCSDGVASYTCSCTSGFSGANCETNVDDCAGAPCQNGGVCSDGVASYTCSCPTGVIGGNCETIVDDCTSNPCLNGGACSVGVTSYSCSCPPVPASGCNVSSGKVQIALRDDADDTKDQATFKWLNGTADPTDFGDPTAATAYTLCVYDADGVVLGAQLEGAANCGTDPCWSTKGSPLSSLKYNDKQKPAGNDGVKQVLGKPDAAGKAKLQVKAAGATLPAFTLGAGLSYPVTAQVITSDAACFEATFDSADEKTNDGEQFKAAHSAP